MAEYRRVTYEDRCQIRAFLHRGVSVKTIAKELGFHKSTIYRELSRNRGRSKKYDAAQAEQLASERFKRCRRTLLLEEEAEGQVLAQLFLDLSPQQISVRMAYEGVLSISHQTIYNYVRRSKRALGPYLRRFNRRGASRLRMKSCKREGKLCIDDRPKVADLRKRFGDWERDCLYGSRRKQILVCTDRKSRFSKLTKIAVFKAKSVTKLTNKLLKDTGRPIHTITNDNGTEFRQSQGSIAPVYYCHPRKPQQRGTVENTIGLIRQYIKRTTDLDELSPKDLQEIENRLNFRPRKCLDYKTPYEVFYGKSVALAV